MCRGISPLATSLVAVQLVSEVIIMISVVPPVIGVLAAVGGGGPSSLGVVIRVLRGSDRQSFLQQKLVVVGHPELGVFGGGNLDKEGDEVPSQVTLKVEKVFEVHKSASFSIILLEIAEVVLVPGICIAAVLSAVAVHPSELLKSAQY